MILNYSTTFQFLDSYVADFNENQDEIKMMVRQSMVATMKEIIRIYGAFLHKAHKITPINPYQLPSLHTNNVQLAKLTHASQRTIKRHIKRLLASGILVQKVWHGSNAPYELFISPKILWINGIGSVEKPKTALDLAQKKSVDIQLDTDSKGTKCPHTEPYKTTYKRNNRVIGVDSVEIQSSNAACQDSGIPDEKTDKTTEKIERSSLSLPDLKRTYKTTEKRTKKTRRKDSFERARRKDAWREGLENNKKIAQKGQTGALNVGVKPKAEPDQGILDEATRHAFLSKYALALWQLAKEVLYKDVWLSKRQQNIGLTLAYNWYESVASHALEKAHQQYTRRIYIVGNYVNKDPDNRFVPLPYQFFDIHNEHGFRKSKNGITRIVIISTFYNCNVLPWMKSESSSEMHKRIRGKVFHYWNRSDKVSSASIS